MLPIRTRNTRTYVPEARSQEAALRVAAERQRARPGLRGASRVGAGLRRRCSPATSEILATIAIEIPDRLQERIRDLVERGWFTSEQQLVQEAVRRFMEAHAAELMERFVREDTEWGLRGTE